MRGDERFCMTKSYLDKNVYDAALERIHFIFDEFDDVCVTFSGGKDSSDLLHLTLQVARMRNRLPLKVMFIDLEAQYRMTIDHVEEMLNRDEITPYWICLPLNLRNAVSVFEPHWCCWDLERREDWVRPMPENRGVISDTGFFPFFRHRMEFEEFAREFAHWLAGDGNIAMLVGIRADESHYRYRTIVGYRKSRHKNRGWTTWLSPQVCNAYPIYDWRVEDVWAYIGKHGLPYNKLYDHMYLSGMTLHKMRICQPYGDDQRKSLDMFHRIEPNTWSKVVNRVAGANYGSLYSGQKILGYRRGIGLPDGHTWESYTSFLLETLPESSRRQYQEKFAIFIYWWRTQGGWQGDIPDVSDPKLEAAKKAPSWRRMAMCILKNDFWCRSLSFAQTKKTYGNHPPTLNRRKRTHVKPEAN